MHIELTFDDLKDLETIIAMGFKEGFEAERLFATLSEGGVVEMPLQLMFWGAWYGSFSDRFGINWMVNYQPSGSRGYSPAET